MLTPSRMRFLFDVVRGTLRIRGGCGLVTRNPLRAGGVSWFGFGPVRSLGCLAVLGVLGSQPGVAVAAEHGAAVARQPSPVAQEVDPSVPPPGENLPVLVVGIKPSPPFVVEARSATAEGGGAGAAQGSWTGVSIDLLDSLAEEIGFDYRLEPFGEKDLAGLLDAVETGRVDLGMAAISMTAEREVRLDFSHPYFAAALGIATRVEDRSAFSGLLRILFAPEVLQFLAGLFVVLTLVGVLAWGFERKRNQQQFGPRPMRGIGNGIWWSIVTMTTVGYGDKSPVTAAGRVLAVIWMFASIVLISTYTAIVASSLTANQLRSPIDGPEDLMDAEVGAIAGTNSRDYLVGQGIG